MKIYSIEALFEGHSHSYGQKKERKVSEFPTFFKQKKKFKPVQYLDNQKNHDTILFNVISIYF